MSLPIPGQMDYLIPGVKGSQTQSIFRTSVKMGDLEVIRGKVRVNFCVGFSQNPLWCHHRYADNLIVLWTGT